MRYGDITAIGDNDFRRENQPGKIVIGTPAAADHLIAYGDSAGGALRNIGVAVVQPVIAIGDLALANATAVMGAAGSGVYAIGLRAMGAATEGTNSIAWGTDALGAWLGLAGSGGHIAIGNDSMAAATGNVRSTVLGHSALSVHTDPGQWVAIGLGAASGATAGARSIAIGDSSGGSLTTIQRSIAIGFNTGGGATGSLTNSVIVGDAAFVARAGAVNLGSNGVFIGYNLAGTAAGAVGDDNTIVGGSAAQALGAATRTTVDRSVGRSCAHNRRRQHVRGLQRRQHDHHGLAQHHPRLGLRGSSCRHRRSSQRCRRALRRHLREQVHPHRWRGRRYQGPSVSRSRK